MILQTSASDIPHLIASNACLVTEIGAAGVLSLLGFSWEPALCERTLSEACCAENLLTPTTPIVATNVRAISAIKTKIRFMICSQFARAFSQLPDKLRSPCEPVSVATTALIALGRFVVRDFARGYDGTMNDQSRRTYQFRLIELFVAVTTFAAVFAAIRLWGIHGFYDRLAAGLFIAGGCINVMEWHYAIKKNLGW